MTSGLDFNRRTDLLRPAPDRSHEARVITQLDRDLRASEELRRWYTAATQETETSAEPPTLLSSGYMLSISEKDDTYIAP